MVPAVAGPRAVGGDVNDEKPVLAPPGAGVPTWQRLGGKHLLLPAWCLWLSWERAVARLEHQGSALVRLADGRSEEELTRRFGEDAEAGYIYRRGGFGVENAAGHERYRYADEEGFDREEEAYERGERAGGYRY